MNKNDTLKPDIRTSQDLTLAELDYTTSIGRKFTLGSISFKASVPITETITISKDALGGVEYDTVLRKIGLSVQDSYEFRPSENEDFQAGDEVQIQCTNANLAGILYVTIKTRELE